jgi:hypothetical protein
MMTAERTTREELIELAVQNGTDRDMAERMIDSLTVERRDALADTFREMLAERDELRARLVANETLRKAICPDTNWKTPADRFDVSRRALKVIEAWAERHGVTVDAIAETLVAQYGTVADGIRMHPDADPRSDGFSGSHPSFYWLAWRLKDAIEILKDDERKAEAARIRAEQDAAWAKQGLVRCERCDGQGGASHWPGFTCFDCDGRCAVPNDFHKHTH